MPIHNGAKYLNECLDSIRNQTYDNLDIVIINDASTDETYNILERVKREDNRIRVLHSKEKKGAAESRNVGLDNAKGEFITFMDADDYIEKDCIETLYNNMDEEDQIVCCGHYEYDEGMETILYSRTFEKRTLNDINEIYDLYLDHYWKGVEMKAVWGKLFSKKTIEDRRFRDYIYGEDQLFLIEIFIANPKVKTIEYAGFKYRKYPESLMGKAELKSVAYFRVILKTLYLTAVEMKEVSKYCKVKSSDKFKKEAMNTVFRLKRWEKDKNAFINNSKVIKEYIKPLKSVCHLSLKEKIILYTYAYCPRLAWLIV